jgi:hypothetical protein
MSLGNVAHGGKRTVIVSPVSGLVDWAWTGRAMENTTVEMALKSILRFIFFAISGQTVVELLMSKVTAAKIKINHYCDLF